MSRRPGACGRGRSSTRNDWRATVLIDSNVLIYRHDPRDRAKQDLAREAFRRLVEVERAATSANCLIEFYRAVTRRLPDPMTEKDALAEVGRYVESLRIVDVTAAVAAEACRGAAEHQISVWDALVWSSAKLDQVPYLLTEDGEHARSIEGVTYLDPFDPRFELATLLA